MSLQQKARQCGRLEIGHVNYDDIREIFGVEIAFLCNNSTPDADDMKSASLAIKSHFQMLLVRNGFWHTTAPNVVILGGGKNAVHFYVSCHATRRQHPLIKLREDSKEIKNEYRN